MPRVSHLPVLLLLTAPLGAQQRPAMPAAPAPITDISPFRRLELPAAGTIRTGSGAPGRDYWQQRADYVIRASLDTVTNVLSGNERIVYRNNSPDTLRYIWLQLDQNVFNSQSRGSQIFDRNSRFGTHGAEGGVSIERVAGGLVGPQDQRMTIRELKTLVNGTMMRLDLNTPLPPRRTYVIEVRWTFPFGPNANRMGIERVDDGPIYEVAQWYPRLAVYDDVRGWNTEQYYGQGEFYLEYGSFDVSLTVPANMLVAATGTLRNPEQVLTPVQRQRLAAARTSDKTVIIRGKDEIGKPASRPVQQGTLTWRFMADSVRDFAWATARHFIWDAVGVSGGKTLAMSFYPPSADSIWKESSRYIKSALEFYSQQWLPYPYPYATNVNGIEGGMEYPMIVFCGNRVSPMSLFSVTDHEFGHTWFPMIVGSNERLYPWMDEGFNNFINYYSQRRWFPELTERRASQRNYIALALSGREQPASSAADRQRPPQLGLQAYVKPAVGMIVLREQILGTERFDPAFREYIRRWAFKHPTPADFFRTMEDAAGEDLSWFWRSWFFTTETLDQAVDSVTTGTVNGRSSANVYLRNAGPMVMPVQLLVTFDDASTERVRLPVEIWFGGNSYVVALPTTKKVRSVDVDPDVVFPDVNRTNNRWPQDPGTP